MSVRAARWLLFAAFALTLPFPMLGPFDALAPALRYAILLGAAGAVALAEGAAGPVPGILALLALNLAAALATAWALAWAIARITGSLGAGLRRGIVVGAALGLLALASVFPIYETGFGRTPTARWLGLFW